MRAQLVLLFVAFLGVSAFQLRDLSFFSADADNDAEKGDIDGPDGDNDAEKGDIDGDGDEFDDEDYEVEVKLADDYLSVSAETISYEIDYQVFTKYNGDDKLVIAIEYEASADAVPESSTQVRFDYIQEWYDANGDGYIQDSEKVGDVYVIGTYGFDPITGNTFSTDGTYTFNIQETSPGYLTVTAHFTSNSNGTTSPNTMKFDVDIVGWPYQSPDNQIALLLEVRANADCDYDEKDGEGEIGEVDVGDPVSSLTWVTNYDHDGIEGEVFSEIIDDAVELEDLGIDVDPDEDGSVIAVWYTFQGSAGSNSISWDPTLGVYSSSSSKSNGSGDDSLSGGAVAGVVIGVLVGVALLAGVAWFVVSRASPKSNELRNNLV